jgi:hypothetical protein
MLCVATADQEMDLMTKTNLHAPIFNLKKRRSELFFHKTAVMARSFFFLLDSSVV